MTTHTVRFCRSTENVTLEEITRAAKVLGLHHPTISEEPGTNGFPFYVLEADEELEVLMDVQVVRPTPRPPSTILAGPAHIRRA